MNEMWWVHLLFGPFLLIVGLAFLKFPPPEINAVYGYRTRRSMASQAAWDFANRLCAYWVVWIAVGLIVFQGVTLLLLEPEMSVMISAFVMTAAVIGMIPVIESKLKRQFS